ncbi:cell polarity protein [Rhizoctonia solani AG-1 IA]|uniref:Cell polarity protein n=1 Tax=Thanatephorus cucumeris (strain AG1-IA) TaxID=983506 RepID=L8X0J5_THACA|nr:cell polarity protein [Rhizoctonia solani AG-1 IA]
MDYSTGIVYVDLAQMADQHTSLLRDKFKIWRAVAAWRQPSVLVLDNLDKVVSAEVEVCFLCPIPERTDVFAESPAPGVALLATCQGPAALHPLLTTSHVFSHKVQLRAPDKAIISRIVNRRLATSDLSSDPAKPLNFVALATDTEGYSATDLQDLVGRAVHAAAVRTAADNASGAPVLLPSDFAKAQEDFVPLTLRGVKLQKSEVSWSDIGLHETRRVLRETLEWPTKYGAIFAKCPLRLRSGLLLYGYPGCGKTLLASAVAKECGLNFISVKGPELLNKYIGQSEQSIYSTVRAQPSPACSSWTSLIQSLQRGESIRFFTATTPNPALGYYRGHDSTGVTDRVVNQMLTQMDGAEGLDGVYVLAATSRPDLIDPALLRPGRLDKSLLCHMPTVDERQEVGVCAQDPIAKIALAPGLDLKEVARRTEGFSGADLQALVYNAQLEVVHEELAAKTQELTEILSSERNEDRVKVEVVGGAVMTRAETAALERRVSESHLGKSESDILLMRSGGNDDRYACPQISVRVHGNGPPRVFLMEINFSASDHPGSFGTFVGEPPSLGVAGRTMATRVVGGDQIRRVPIGSDRRAQGAPWLERCRGTGDVGIGIKVRIGEDGESWYFGWFLSARTMATARRAPSPSASTTYSGFSGYRDSQRQPANGMRPTPPLPGAADSRAIAKTHFEELKKSLQDHMLREPQNSRANAREKLTRLTRQQFQELSTDVYDELMRRNENEKGGAETPFLPVRDDFHPKRNQARQKLATLPAIRFKDLSSDVFYELGRRYPEFKEPEQLPEVPDTPASEYDPPTPELVGGRGPNRQSSRDQGFSTAAGSGSDRRRPSQDDFGVRRRPSQDETRRRPSADQIPYRRPSQDSQLGRRPSQDKPSGMASSSYVTPTKSTIAEEDIEVPYGRDEGTDDEEYDDDEGTKRPLSEDDRNGHSKKPSQGGLNALGFNLLSAPMSPTSDDGAPVNGLNGRTNSDYYEKMSFGRASVTSSQGAGAAGELKRGEIEDLRRDYEFKIATMQSKLASYEDKGRSDAERIRSLEGELRDSRRVASEREAEARKLRERCDQLEEDLQDAQDGQGNTGSSGGEVTEQLRREMQALLDDLRAMAASREDLAAERNADSQTIRELSSQVQEYKRKYEAAKTELRGLKATSQLYVQQPVDLNKQDQLPVSERGAIVDVHITQFQSAIDTMLMAGRSNTPSTTLTAMKAVVTSVSAIADDVESYVRHQRVPSEHENATQLVERLHATLGNLVAAARTHAMSFGTSPVSLLDAAASHVSTTVTALVREVLVRRDDGKRSSTTNNWTHLENELKRPLSDRSSSVGSPHNPAIFDTPLQTASTNGGASDAEGGDDAWEELKPYLEAQSESIAFSIQALLSAIRNGAQGPEINENLAQIISIVSSIIAVSKESLPRASVRQGTEIVSQLSEQCDRLSELQGRVELTKQDRQAMAANAFGVAKAMKELMKL